MATMPEDDVDTADLTAPRTFLRRVRIRNFKSIRFCDVHLEPLTILVGRNASGKSNFLDALAFFRDLIDMPVSRAVQRRPGWRSIGRNTHPASPLEMRFDLRIAIDETLWDAEVSFSLEAREGSTGVFSEQSVRLRDRRTDSELGYRFADGRFEWLGSDRALSAPRPPTEHFHLRKMTELPYEVLTAQLRNAEIYNPYPAILRMHQPRGLGPRMQPDGQALAVAIEAMEASDPDTLERIKCYLRAIVPDVRNFQAQRYGDFETVRFNLASGTELDASSMSDGTMRALALLVAVFQEGIELEPPGFIGIEEPELALHPAALPALMAAFDEATLRNQILLTTHSPDLINLSAVKPENIRVAQWIDDQTRIESLDAVHMEVVRDHLVSLGDLLRDQQLHMEAATIDNASPEREG